MEAVGGLPKLLTGRRAAVAGATAITVVLGFALFRSVVTPSGGSPPVAPVPGATVPAGLGLPALFVPRGDIGVRVHLVKGVVLAIGLGAAPKSPWHPISAAPFRVISSTTGHVWRLRTGRSGRAQLAVPPGRYEVTLGWAQSRGAPWTFDAVRDRAVREGRTMTPSFFKNTDPP